MSSPLDQLFSRRQLLEVAAAGSLAEIWSQLFPWDDLQAKGVPERHLALGTDVLPTLAVLAAQSQLGPKLLQAGPTGQLLTDPTAPIALGELIIPTNVSLNTLTVTRPLGARVIQVTVKSTSSLLDLLVVGKQSNTTYLHVTGTAPAPVSAISYFCPVTEPSDLQIVVTAQPSAAGSGDLLISGLPAIPQQPVQSFPINFTLNAGQLVTLVPAHSGMVVYLVGLFVATPGAVNALINIEDDTPKVLAEVWTNVTHAAYRELHGIAGTVGHLVRANNTAGLAAAATVGELLFVQGSPNLAPGAGLPM